MLAMAFVVHAAAPATPALTSPGRCPLNASSFRVPMRALVAPLQQKTGVPKEQLAQGQEQRTRRVAVEASSGGGCAGVSPEDGDKGTVIVLGGDGFCGKSRCFTDGAS
jgi:hypothetical protein